MPFLNSISFPFSLVFIIIFSSCSPELDTIPKYKTDFCASIHRNDSITLSNELKAIEDSMVKKRAYTF